jgi:hypothetical protein
MSEQEILKFNESLGTVFALLQEDLERQKAILRPFAERLMLCPNVNAAITLLQQDLKAGLIAVCTTRELPHKERTRAIRLAFEKAPANSSILPCMPLAMFLIELCDSLEMPKAN